MCCCFLFKNQVTFPSHINPQRTRFVSFSKLRVKTCRIICTAMFKAFVPLKTWERKSYAFWHPITYFAIEIFLIILFVCFAQNHNCCISLHFKICSTSFFCVLKSHHNLIVWRPSKMCGRLFEKRSQNVVIVGVVAWAAWWWCVEIWRIEIRQQFQRIYVHVIRK